MMKVGERYSFWNLINEFNILIPSIQRDYVQGRKNLKSEKNRKDIVSSIYNSLINDLKLDFNFTYGQVKNNIFIPIDGQQRITTLFVLYFYIIVKTNNYSLHKDILKKFKYETRRTTSKFLELLLKNPIITNIKNASWYVNSFNFDLTITSIIDVLNDFNEIFKETTDDQLQLILKKLISANPFECPINFMYINLDINTNDNDLYIKMNSRGKQLSSFENLKCDLYDYIDDLPEDLHCIYDSYINNFKNKIDGEWLDLFWEKRIDEDIERKICYIDDYFFVLFYWINVCVYTEICDDASRPENIIFEKRINPSTIDPGMMFFSDFLLKDGMATSLNNNKEFILKTIKQFSILMDFFALNNDFINKLLDLNMEIKRNHRVGDSNIQNYNKRLILSGIIKFFEDKGNYAVNDDFIFFLRTLEHIVGNAEIDNSDKFRKTLKRIINFPHYNDFLDYTTNTNDQMYDFLSGTPDTKNKIQEEEMLKNKIRISDANWKDAIDSAEEIQRDYINGQIEYLFKFADVNSLADANQNSLEKFKEYTKTFSETIVNTLEDFKKNELHLCLLAFVDDVNYVDKLFKKREGNVEIYMFCPNRQDDRRHRNNDWIGQLLSNDYLRNTYKRMLDSFQKAKSLNEISFTEFANEEISNFLQSHASFENSPNPKEKLVFALLKSNWTFDKFDHKHHYFLFVENGNYCLMKTTVRKDFVDVNVLLKYISGNRNVKKISELNEYSVSMMLPGDTQSKKYIYDRNANVFKALNNS